MFTKGSDQKAVVSGFFTWVLRNSTRDFHPVLVAVLTTNTDKRGEPALSSLSEHLSGESQVGGKQGIETPMNLA